MNLIIEEIKREKTMKLIIDTFLPLIAICLGALLGMIMAKIDEHFHIFEEGEDKENGNRKIL